MPGAQRDGAAAPTVPGRVTLQLIQPQTAHRALQTQVGHLPLLFRAVGLSGGLFLVPFHLGKLPQDLFPLPVLPGPAAQRHLGAQLAAGADYIGQQPFSGPNGAADDSARPEVTRTLPSQYSVQPMTQSLYKSLPA